MNRQRDIKDHRVRYSGSFEQKDHGVRYYGSRVPGWFSGVRYSGSFSTLKDHDVKYDGSSRWFFGNHYAGFHKKPQGQAPATTISLSGFMSY